MGQVYTFGSNWIKSVLPFSSRATFLTSSLKSASSCTYGIATSSCYERKNTGIASCTLGRKVCQKHNTLVLKYPSDKHFDFYTSRVLQEDQKSNRTEPNLISWAMKRSRFFAISHESGYWLQWLTECFCMVLISSSPQNFPYASKQFHWNISLTFKRNESILTTLQKGYQSQKITKQVTNYVSYICCRSFAGDRKSNCLFFLNCTENLYWCKKKNYYLWERKVLNWTN